MPLSAASSCLDLFKRHKLYIVFRTWFDISLKWGSLELLRSRSVKTSIAFEFCSESSVVESMERFLMNFSKVI